MKGGASGGGAVAATAALLLAGLAMASGPDAAGAAGALEPTAALADRILRHGPA